MTENGYKDLCRFWKDLRRHTLLSIGLDDCTLMHKRSVIHRNADIHACWAVGLYKDAWICEEVHVKEQECGPRLIPKSPTATHDLNGQQSTGDIGT